MFDSLTGNGRVWIFTSNRKLTTREVDEINAKFDVFCKDWSAHGSQLKASFQIFNNQILVLGADEDFEPASGCSIDRSTAIFQEIDQTLKIDLFNRLNLAFKENDEIIIVRMADIQSAYDLKKITDSSTFFDNSVNTLQDIRIRWKMPFSKSWAYAKIKK
ncbi:MAG: ABC transporter ATPase [Bacteroidia bacterium]|nr:ABC transporter ATPase [Bacteroidia bacterium]|tara:strand:+ start:19816 stop:20295 length:480 start_codon:yes stop_codon:yes gene_type:complete